MAAPEERFLSTEEVAERLQVDEQTVRRWIKSGKLEAVKPGREWRIPPAAFEALLEGYSSPKTPGSSPEAAEDQAGEERRALEELEELREDAEQRCLFYVGFVSEAATRIRDRWKELAARNTFSEGELDEGIRAFKDLEAAFDSAVPTSYLRRGNEWLPDEERAALTEAFASVENLRTTLAVAHKALTPRLDRDELAAHRERKETLLQGRIAS